MITHAGASKGPILPRRASRAKNGATADRAPPGAVQAHQLGPAVQESIVPKVVPGQRAISRGGYRKYIEPILGCAFYLKTSINSDLLPLLPFRLHATGSWVR